MNNKDRQAAYALTSAKQLMDLQHASQQEKEMTKKPGLWNLITDTQQLILNATAVSPFESAASEPTEILQQNRRENIHHSKDHFPKEVQERQSARCTKPRTHNGHPCRHVSLGHPRFPIEPKHVLLRMSAAYSI